MFKNFSLLFSLVLIMGCGFHLRGRSGSYVFPYATVKLDCNSAVICSGLRNTIIAESLTTLVNSQEQAEVVIVVNNEQTSRDTLDFNRVGQIASYILTYQITARVFARSGEQIGSDMVVQNQQVMNYNNSLILSAQQQEEVSWDLIHQNVINSLIRRIVYSNSRQLTPYVAESH